MIKNTANILMLPGDGVGPEVVKSIQELINVMDQFTQYSFSIEEELIGGVYQ